MLKVRPEKATSNEMSVIQIIAFIIYRKLRQRRQAFKEILKYVIEHFLLSVSIASEYSNPIYLRCQMVESFCTEASFGLY